MGINDYSVSSFLVLGLSTALYFHFHGRRDKGEKKDVHRKNNNVQRYQIVGDRLSTLPQHIQRHLHKALLLNQVGGSRSNLEDIREKSFRFIKSVHIEQEGSYLQNNGRWVSFHGNQEITTNPASPGFIFDEDVKLLGDSPFFNRLEIHVRDTFIDGKSDVSVDFMKIFPIVSHADISTMNEGHLEQWMANIPLYPTSFIYQSDGLLVWSDQESLSFIQNGKITDKLPSSYPEYPKVVARITEPNSADTAEVEYTFDDNGLIVAASGVLHPEKRNYPTEQGEESVRIWERRFLDYQVHDGLLVPTKIEFGWWDKKMQIFHVNVRLSITKIVYIFEE